MVLEETLGSGAGVLLVNEITVEPATFIWERKVTYSTAHIKAIDVEITPAHCKPLTLPSVATVCYSLII